MTERAQSVLATEYHLELWETHILMLQAGLTLNLPLDEGPCVEIRYVPVKLVRTNEQKRGGVGTRGEDKGEGMSWIRAAEQEPEKGEQVWLYGRPVHAEEEEAPVVELGYFEGLWYDVTGRWFPEVTHWQAVEFLAPEPPEAVHGQ